MLQLPPALRFPAHDTKTLTPICDESADSPRKPLRLRTKVKEAGAHSKMRELRRAFQQPRELLFLPPFVTVPTAPAESPQSLPACSRTPTLPQQAAFRTVRTPMPARQPSLPPEE